MAKSMADVLREEGIEQAKREGTIEVADLPAGLPILVGHMVPEYLDLCLDIKEGIIYNPAHYDEWIEDQFQQNTSTRKQRK